MLIAQKRRLARDAARRQRGNRFTACAVLSFSVSQLRVSTLRTFDLRPRDCIICNHRGRQDRLLPNQEPPT